MADRNRRRINIEGVLRFALEHQDIVPTGEFNYQPASEDRRTWLRAALEFLSSAESEIDRLKACTEILKKSEIKRNDRNIDVYADSDEDKKLVSNALEEIIEIIDQIDNARDFCTIGGFKYVVNLIKDIKNVDIVILACNVIATVTQNNPSCQEFAVRCDVIQPLLTALQNFNASEVKIKCVYALSSLIRDNAKALESFTENDGFSIIVRCLQVKAPKLRTKVAFLCKALCTYQPELKDVLFRVGFVDHLAVVLQDTHDAYHEYVLSALLVITEDHSPSIEACRQPHLELEKSLHSIKDLILSNSQLREAQQEELHYCEKLISCCFADDSFTVGNR